MVRLVSLLFTIVLLHGCSSGSAGISNTLRLIGSSSQAVDQAPLQPHLRYLRTESDGQVTLMPLGYVDDDANGTVEVWYGGLGQVLRLRNGRIVGSTGLTTDWSAVKLPPLPRWQDISTPLRYQREHDEMPGYRANIRETVSLRAIAPPARSRLKQLAPAQLRWFEESVETGTPGRPALPPSRFAVAMEDGYETVVYSEQCLAPTLCFALQSWPPPSGGKE